MPHAHLAALARDNLSETRKVAAQQADILIIDFFYFMQTKAADALFAVGL